MHIVPLRLLYKNQQNFEDIQYSFSKAFSLKMFLLYLIFHETFLPVKDTMNANFSIKKKNLMTIELHIIKQPIQYCFEDVICFSAQIYDNSLLML